MQYILTFLEGVIAFVSPCLLPMLPLYITYFAGQENKKGKTFINAIGFVTGFTILFVLLGAFAGSIGSFFNQNKTVINIVSGLVIILFGISFSGIFRIPWISSNHQKEFNFKSINFLSSILFGIVFAVSWTPCVGAFLGAALMMAANNGNIIQSMLLLFMFSLGLGIPFIISAILIEKLKGAFNFIKKNYSIIKVISSVFLILMGITMMFGLMEKITRMLM